MLACPRCADSVPLLRRMTDQGIEVDVCNRCRGLWLDRGELQSFARDSQTVTRMIDAARTGASAGALKSPVSGAPMNVLRVLGGQLEIDECPKSGGLWLDRGELERVTRQVGVTVRLDESVLPPEVNAPVPAGPGAPESPDPTRAARLAAIAAGLTPLPNLFLRTGALLVTLYGILGLVLIAAVEAGGLEPVFAPVIGIAIIVLQFAISPWLMDFSLWAFYRCRALTPDELPPHLRQFVERVCADRRMNFPRFKIIDDGAPNAFTYGHYPGNARIVITRGILELLDPAEVEAVVAHEIGHAVHWDMALMTIAQLVPLVLYYIYRTLIRVRGRGKGAGQRVIVAMGAYVLYIVTQYLVLWFSRTREYHADRFAGNATRNPNAIASALVKIAYGLAARPAAAQQQEGEAPRRELDAIGAMGIFDAGAARALAISSGSRSGGLVVDKERLVDAMKWDLWNPWATYYEIHSTHPLIAHRLIYLGEQSAAMGQPPYVVFSARKPESYWDEFFVDLFVLWFPTMLFIAGAVAALVTRTPALVGLGLAGAGLASVVKLMFSYPTRDFPPTSVSGLLKHVKVSKIRSVPCTLRGKVIGRGVPGLVWSEDFVMQDDTGILFLDYRQPLGIWEWLFGLLRAGAWQGRDVTVTGWYRRAPVPYLEVRTIEGAGDSSKSWLLAWRWALAFLTIAGGLVLAAVLTMQAR
jgi:Zn-dependent protease with chaperone function/Zn-finger nucleic acid-binding protein